MKEFVLLTGASSGIGYEMAKLLAKQRFNLIIAARRIEKLDLLKAALENQYGVIVHTMKVDLSNPENAMHLYDDIKGRNLNVTMLINNAGFGDYGNFIDIPLARQVDMINVNITSLMILCKLFLQDMQVAGKGKLMNVASILSYLPFPYYSVYSATKTFVLSFTETLAAEFSDTAIDIKALCPGPVDTEFNTTEMLSTNAYKGNKPMSAVKVAEVGVKHLLSGKGSKKVGFKTWFITNLPRFTPDTIMMKIKKNLASQRIKPKTT
ncbi:SDR family oxidoreductase [soil metagenome]